MIPRMQTGEPKLLDFNHDEIRARKYAAMFTHELRDYIPAACMSHAQHHLARLFMDQKVHISTEETRALKRVTGYDAL